MEDVVMNKNNLLNRYLKRKKSFSFYLITFLTIIYLIISNYLIYNIYLLNSIENTIRYIAIGGLALLNIIIIIRAMVVVIKSKFKPLTIFLVVIIILGSIQGLIALNINRAYSSINKMNKQYLDYTTKLVVMSDSKLDNANSMKNKKIGIISDTNSIEGYVISQDMIKEYNLKKNNKLINYDDFAGIISALYEGDIDVAFLPGNYTIMYRSIERFENIATETKTLVSKTEKKKKQAESTNLTSSKKLTEPFTMLIMGVDATEENINSNQAFNGDALMLITFNPNTLNATILSIPRDTFVPIMCFKNHIENKITHAAWYGESCMMSTIENFTGIDIDYYVKINFKGVVHLVDALGGIDVNVPIKFCEQDSNRKWGNNMICLDKGIQSLNGEQALALSRHRKTINDIERGQNQQLIINAIANKAKSIRNIETLYNLLDALEKNMDTNLTTNQILSFYNVGKNILLKSKDTNGDFIRMQHLYLSGYDQMIYDEGMGLTLYNYIYYRGSLKDVVDAMKENLELKQTTPIKTFTYSMNEPYEEPIVGKGTYKIVDYIETVPDFIGSTKDKVLSWGNKKGVKINIETIDSSSSSYKQDQVTSQSAPWGYRVARLSNNTLTIKVINKITQTIPEPQTLDCSDEKNDTNKSCLVPNMSGWNEAEVTSWFNKINKYNVSIIKDKSIFVDPDILIDSEVKNAGKVKSNTNAGKLLRKIDSIQLTWYNELKPSDGDDDPSTDPLDPILP